MIGASTAAAAISTRVGIAVLDHAPSACLVTANRGTPPPPLATRYAERPSKRVIAEADRVDGPRQHAGAWPA